jgi:hypothetical protein
MDKFLRVFLFRHNLAVTITDRLVIKLQGNNDQCIMQLTKMRHLSKQDQLDINLVRLHLQVITLSDISTLDGNSISKDAYHGRRHGSAKPRTNWPRQPTPTANQIKVWQRYLSDNFLRFTTKWEHRLGPVAPNTVRTLQTLARLEPSKHIRSIPVIMTP